MKGLIKLQPQSNLRPQAEDLRKYHCGAIPKADHGHSSPSRKQRSWSLPSQSNVPRTIADTRQCTKRSAVGKVHHVLREDLGVLEHNELSVQLPSSGDAIGDALVGDQAVIKDPLYRGVRRAPALIACVRGVGHQAQGEAAVEHAPVPLGVGLGAVLEGFASLHCKVHPRSVQALPRKAVVQAFPGNLRHGAGRAAVEEVDLIQLRPQRGAVRAQVHRGMHRGDRQLARLLIVDHLLAVAVLLEELVVLVPLHPVDDNGLGGIGSAGGAVVRGLAHQPLQDRGQLGGDVHKAVLTSPVSTRAT
eukprot:RCo051817